MTAATKTTLKSTPGDNLGGRVRENRMSWGYGTAELDFSRVMRTEDHVDHDDGHNEQDDGDDNGRDDDDDTTINCWRRFGGEDTREKGRVGGVEQWMLVEFFFEGDEDDVDCIDDGHNGADCCDDDGREEDDKGEHFDTAGVKYNNKDSNDNGNDGNHDEDDGIGGHEDKSTINNYETMTV